MVRAKNPRPRKEEFVYNDSLDWLRRMYPDLSYAEAISFLIEDFQPRRLNSTNNTISSKNEYDALIRNAQLLIVGHENQAVRFIPKAYSFLIEIGHTPIEAGDKVRDDFRGCWLPTTIRKVLRNQN